MLAAALIGASALALAQGSAPHPDGSSSAGQPARVNVNTATEAELRTLPGIDELAARRIVAGRPYQTIAKFLNAAQLPVTEAQAVQGRIVLSDEPPPPIVAAPPPPKEAAKPRPASKGSGSRSAQAGATRSEMSATGPAPRPARLNVNHATLEQLMGLPGVDYDLARRIIAGRPYRNAAKFFEAIKLSPDEAQRLESRLRF